jgi:hypothetical protein
VNKTSVNVGVQLFLQNPDFHSLAYISRSTIAALYCDFFNLSYMSIRIDTFLFKYVVTTTKIDGVCRDFKRNFLSHCSTVFHISCTFYIPNNSAQGSGFSTSLPTLVFSLDVAVLMGERRRLIKCVLF